MIFSLGHTGLREIQNNSSYTGIEIGSALARIAGERISIDKDVELSATMKDIVNRSRDNRAQNGSSFSIDEIFLLNKNGIPLAHSDVGKMAKNSEIDYSKPEYKSILNKEQLSYRPVYEKQILESHSFADGELYDSLRNLNKDLAQKFERTFPEKIITRYRLGIAVFRVDETLASAGIHMVVTTQSVNKYLKALKEYSIVTLIWIYASVFIITSCIFFLSLLVYYGTFNKLKKANKKLVVLSSQVSQLEHADDTTEPENDSQVIQSEENEQIAGSADQPVLENDGPTAAELEIMEEAQHRQSVRQEITANSTRQSMHHSHLAYEDIQNKSADQDYFTGNDIKNELYDEEVFDAIPLDNITASKSRNFGNLNEEDMESQETGNNF